MEEHAGSSNVTWYGCSRKLRGEGYVHTAGDRFAKLTGRTITHRATIKRWPSGAHGVQYDLNNPDR